MKVKTLIHQLYIAIAKKDKDEQQRIYKKITKKSLKHKKTQAVQ